MKAYIGIDNGTTGTMGIIRSSGEYDLIKTPSQKHLSYQKAVTYINRLDHTTFRRVLSDWSSGASEVHIVIERPFSMQQNTAAVRSAQRADEAMIISLEILGLPYEYTDSKSWQKLFLPSCLKGSAALKKASKERGRQLFPLVDGNFQDYDGLFIAKYAQTKAIGL